MMRMMMRMMMMIMVRLRCHPRWFHWPALVL